MRFGFVGSSYTAQSSAVADEECINWFSETVESSSAATQAQEYGGRAYAALKSYFGTPGLSVFVAFPSGPVRGSLEINGRAFFVADNNFIEVTADGTQTIFGKVATDANPATMVSNGIQILICSGGHAYCFSLDTVGWLPTFGYAAGSLILDPNHNYQRASARLWSGNVAWAVGAQIVDANGNVQAVTTAGISGLAAPTWNIAGTTVDGTVIWTFATLYPANVGTSGTAIPTFGIALRSTTADNGTLVWTNIGTRLLDITTQLVGTPVKCECSDTYGIIMFQNSNKFQMSQLLDFSTWPGTLVNAISVFAGNISSIIVNHRELWVFGSNRSQPYQDTGSLEVFDVISGTTIEAGCVAAYSPTRLDNSVFWIGQDERGAVVGWRSNGYTPARVTTHAVETWLSQQTNIAALVSYSYQDRGHMFWVLYVPGSECSWVFDLGENMWHKRAAWNASIGTYSSHWSWNHVYVFGKHLVGDWNSSNLYQMNYASLTDNGSPIRRLRRAPTVSNEMEFMYHTQLTVDFDNGLGPQPPLVDGSGNPRPPQAMLRWSDDRGRTWSNQHVANCGFAGEYTTRTIWRRLGRSRYRVYELAVTDPIQWTVVDAYLIIVGGA